MKKIYILAALFTCVFQLGISQNLDLIYAEKFDFQEVIFDNNTGFENDAIMCNHKTDLSYFNEDFDPMGALSGTLFFHGFDELNYAGTFTSESEIGLLDININENTDHQTILLDLEEPCSFISPGQADLNLDFPEFANMTGIVNSNNSSGGDTFWLSYILAIEEGRPKLWTAGDLTIITGSAIDNQLQYVNPDGTIIDIEVSNIYNQYIIAIDEFGTYQWSHIYQSSEYDILGGFNTQIVEHDDEIVVSTNLSVEDGLLIIGTILYLDSSGNQVKDLIEFPWVVINKLDFGLSDNMLICGFYYGSVGDTNMDINGGEFYFDEDLMQIYNGYLLRYSQNGSVDWAQTIEGSGQIDGTSFDFTDEHIYLTGQVSESVIFDKDGDNPMVFDSIEKKEMFISKYTIDGNLKWVNIFESGFGSRSDAISIIGDEITLFGSFSATLDANPNPLEEDILTNENPNNLQSFFVLDFKELVVSTSDIEKAKSTLSPNPVSNVLNTLNSNERIVRIKNLAGNSVRIYNSSSVDVSGIPNGMYIVETELDGKITSQLISIFH